MRRLKPCLDDLENTLVEILSEHTTCIAHEINDRACWEHFVPYESFRDLRVARDNLISKELVEEVKKPSPYGKLYKFFHLTTTDVSNVKGMIENKYKLLLEYSEHTGEIGHFGEGLVADAIESLGYTDIKVRKRQGKKDVDVFCRDRTGEFYWAIECKNRRQEIDKNDILAAFEKAEEASSRWNVKPVKPAMISSSIYNRIPEIVTPAIIFTGRIFVPDKEFFHKYKDSLSSWYIEPVNDVPDDLVEQIDLWLKE